MNTDPESIAPDSSRPSQPKAKPHSRRNGNIARLPKAVRDQVNLMIQDGVAYSAIIQCLGENGKGLCPSNFTHWKDGGYKDWVLEQTWLADTRARQESACDLAANFNPAQVNEAALQLAALHIFEALRKLGPGETLDEKLGGDSAAFARLIHALARASHETLKLQEYRAEYEGTRLAVQALGGMDKIFDFPRRDKPANTNDKPATKGKPLN